MDDADTIAAIATAPGTGGLGVIRVSGRGVLAIAEAMTGRHLSPRLATLARFMDEDGRPIDEGIGLYFDRPRSYTGEDVLEIHAHGGPTVLRRLLERCLALGARPAQPGEFTKRAFLNGKMDLAQAEAVADLIAARTDQAARSAARSLTGEFSRKVMGLQDVLTELRVVLEGALDFPDEGIDFVADMGVHERLDALSVGLEGVLRAGRTGRRLREGLTVCLVGPPNAGKSSIVNRLSGDDVAIVTPIPGTTRDLIRESIEIDGVPMEIVDTAGLRSDAGPVEAEGIARTWRALSSTDIVMVVLDDTGEFRLDENDIKRLPTSGRRVWVHNKIDITGRAAGRDERQDGCHVAVSALTGAGFDELRQTLLPQDEMGGYLDDAFAARGRQLEALERARIAVGMAREVLHAPELAAEELRQAQSALAMITGEICADDLLGEIFSRFCIGK